MSEQPTSPNRDNATPFSDKDRLDFHASELPPRNPFVRPEKPEIHRPLHELAVEGIKARTKNLVWARTTEQDINGSWLRKDAA